MTDKEIIRISKFLSLILRHEPERIGLKLDSAAWVGVTELLEAVNRNGVSRTLDHVSYRKLIPSEWLTRICEWPRSLKVLEQAAERLALQKAGVSIHGQLRYFWPGLVPRNLAFLLIVLATVSDGLRCHNEGLRR